MKRQPILMLTGALFVGLLLVLAVGISLAQEPQPAEGQADLAASTGAAEITPGAIAIQGRLTDAGGTPLNGTYDVTFRLYEQSSGGTPLCTDTNSIQVTGGLFSSYLDHCYNDLNGQKVWLGIEVGSDGEMTPRQVIYAVPYALSLRPSAVISGTTSGRVLYVRNYGSGQGLLGYSKNNDGVYGWSDASDHAGVSGENTSGGIGVYGWSNGGPAIKAAGRIESTAKSYLWISGNGVRPFHQSDSTIIDMDSVGGAFVKRGADAGRKNVMLPITVVAPLYGQEVTISALDIYWKGETEFDGLTAVILRRQTGVGRYANIVFDVGGAGYACESSAHPDGCTQHYDTTSNNVLTADSGILYLTLEFAFNSSTSWVEIGGVRLTLEHD
jgi:hypothetical protein